MIQLVNVLKNVTSRLKRSLVHFKESIPVACHVSDIFTGFPA